jgi:addiction module HigA family antidote
MENVVTDHGTLAEPVHPGKILREVLDEIGLSANALAKALSVPTNRITSILKGTRAITADTALRFARYFGTTPEYWLNLQLAYELHQAKSMAGPDIESKIAPLAA